MTRLTLVLFVIEIFFMHGCSPVAPAGRTSRIRGPVRWPVLTASRSEPVHAAVGFSRVKRRIPPGRALLTVGAVGAGGR